MTEKHTSSQVNTENTQAIRPTQKNTQAVRTTQKNTQAIQSKQVKTQVIKWPATRQSDLPGKQSLALSLKPPAGCVLPPTVTVLQPQSHAWQLPQTSSWTGGSSPQMPGNRQQQQQICCPYFHLKTRQDPNTYKIKRNANLTMAIQSVQICGQSPFFNNK